MNLEKIVAQNVRGYRKKRSFTQETLAAKALRHSNHLARIERNEVGASLTTLAKIAKALKIDPYLLLIIDSFKAEE